MGIGRESVMEDGANARSVALGKSMSQPEAEFIEFITSIGWGSAYRYDSAAEEPIASRQPVVESIPPALPEESKAPPAANAPQKGAAIRYAFATFLVLGIVFRQPIENAVTGGWSHFAGRSREESRARDLLMQAQFRSQLPGATGEEVRERVGLPLSRGSGVAVKAEEAWYYVARGVDTHGPARVYLVALSNNKVVRVLDITEQPISAQMINSTACAPRYLGDLKVMHRGRRSILKNLTGTAVLLVGPSLEMPKLPQADVRVLQPERMTLVKSGAAVEAPPLAVYWRGVLYPLPFCTPTTPSDALAADLRWLFRTLGCDETGKQLAPGFPDSPEPVRN